MINNIRIFTSIRSLLNALFIMTTIVAQINLHHCQKSVIDFHEYARSTIEKHGNLIAAIQEPWVPPVNKGMIAILPDRNMLYKRLPPDQPVVRAAIFGSPGVRLQPCEQFMSRDCAAAMWSTGDARAPKILVVSMYMDKNLPFPDELEKVINWCARKNVPLMLMMDSNSHSVIYGEYKTDDRGHKLEAIVFQRNLHIVNEGSRPDVATYRKGDTTDESIIDLTMCTGGIEQYITDWKIDMEREKVHSDHFLIDMKFNVDNTKSIGCHVKPIDDHILFFLAPVIPEGF